MYPYNFKFGQKIQSDAVGINPDRGFIARVTYTEPAAKSITGILAATELKEEEQTITEGITDPDVPRNVRIKGSADVTGDVVINGTNINDDAISETLALNGTTEVEGDLAFKTITSIELPAQATENADTVQVGTANKLGLPYKLSLNTVLKAYRNSVLETSAPTVTVDADDLEKNTIELSSALNGTNVDVIIIV